MGGFPKVTLIWGWVMPAKRIEVYSVRPKKVVIRKLMKAVSGCLLQKESDDLFSIWGISGLVVLSHSLSLNCQIESSLIG